MSRIKRLDTRILTIEEVSKDFGWKEPFVMFDDKFPYRTIVELGATDEDLSHRWALRQQVELIANNRSIHNTYREVCDPEQFAEVLVRLIH